MSPEEREELLAGYALGTLSEPDAAAVADLVHRNPLAAAELAGYHEIVDLIALDVPLRRADPSLRRRVIAAARRGGRPRRRLPFWRSLGAAAVVAAISFIGVWAIQLQGELSDLRQETATLAAIVEADAKQIDTLIAGRQDGAVEALRTQLDTVSDKQDLIVAVTTDPQAWSGALEPTDAAHGATAQVIWSVTHNAGLVVLTDLPLLPIGFAYQIFIDDGTELLPTVVFEPGANGEAQALIEPGRPFDPVYMVVAVSPASGSTTVEPPVVLAGVVNR